MRAAPAIPAVAAEPEIALPGRDELRSFAQHVKPQFRQRDRDSMRFAFDLWSHAEVGTHAERIVERLSAGTMPCDGAWPPARVDLLERCVAAGRPA
jgi:hypothetical protein